MVFIQGGLYEAWVTLGGPDGGRREEYAVEVDEQAKWVTCWIASEIGKTFQVCWKAPMTSFHCTGHMHLDGHKAGGEIRAAYSNPTTVTVHQGYSTSPTTERPYIFSSLEVTDDDVYLSADFSGDIGEIRLQINKVELGESTSRQPMKPPPTDQKVHECSKKALVHRVRYGEERVMSNVARKRWTIQRMERLATFVFKYRNLDMLQAMDIAQPPPEPQQTQVPEPSRKGLKRKPLPIKQEDPQGTEEDDEDDDEERALLAKLAEVRARRSEKGPNRPRKKIKKEDTSVEMNYTVLPGGIIDLT